MIISLEKIVRLTDGQHKRLHESIGKYLEENLKEIKAVNFIEENFLDDYLAKISLLRDDFHIKKADQSLNVELYVIIEAAVKNSSNGEHSNAVSLFIQHISMRYQQMKYLDDCLKLIQSLHNTNVKVIEFNQITDAVATIKLEDDIAYIYYSLPFSSESWNLIQNLSKLHFELNSRLYSVETGDFYIESSSDDIGEKSCLSGKIRVNKLSGSEFAKKEKSYFRCMIPISSVDWNMDICTTLAFIKNGWTMGLIELKDNDILLHVYPSNAEDQKFMVIESLTETTKERIVEYVYSVSLTMGFITGIIHLGKCYVFSSIEPEFGNFVSLAYYTMRPSSEASMRIFTTNMYFVRETLKSRNVNLKDATPLYNQDGIFQQHLQDWLQQSDIQSLFELIHGDEKIARAVVTIIESTNFPLEYQASVRAIVLEILARSVEGPKPISDDELWIKVKTDMERVVSHYAKNEVGDQQISNESLTILGKKINNLNNPTNADSLAKPFEDANYILTENDKKALKTRNTFLHGGIAKGTLEKQTEELFYLSLMLHKLACIIILKKTGFKGYILNNPVLYNCKKAVEAGEQALLFI